MADDLIGKRISKGTSKKLGPVLIPNPLSEGIARTWSLFTTLNFSLLYFLPSLLTSAALVLVLVVLIILWPYGWLAVISHFLWGFVRTAVTQIQQAPTYAEKMPFTVALGIYFLIWLPIGALCLPLMLIGMFGELVVEFLTEDRKAISRREARAPEPVQTHEGLKARDRPGQVAETRSENTIDRRLICRISGIGLDDEKYRLDVVSAEWLPKHQIKVEFVNHNKTTSILHAFFRERESFFVDEMGYQYDCKSSENIKYGRDIPPGVSIRYAMFFYAPNRPPKKITLQLLGSPGAGDGSCKWSLPTIECNWQWEQLGIEGK